MRSITACLNAPSLLLPPAGARRERDGSAPPDTTLTHGMRSRVVPAMTTLFTTISSPIGELTIVSDGEALTGLYMAEHSGRPPLPAGGVRDDAALAEPARQLRQFFRGERTEFELPIRPAGTPFQRAVWAALLAVPYGETASYGELAQHVGRPGAARAVGLANA